MEGSSMDASSYNFIDRLIHTIAVWSPEKPANPNDKLGFAADQFYITGSWIPGIDYLPTFVSSNLVAGARTLTGYFGSGSQSTVGVANVLKELTLSYTDEFERLINLEKGSIPIDEVIKLKDKLIQLKEALKVFDTGVQCLLQGPLEDTKKNALREADQGLVAKMNEEIEKLSGKILSEYVIFRTASGLKEDNQPHKDYSDCNFAQTNCFKTLKKTVASEHSLILEVNLEDMREIKLKNGSLILTNENFLEVVNFFSKSTNNKNLIDKHVQKNIKELTQEELDYPEADITKMASYFPKIESQSYGFKTLSGFNLKIRNDGYITADRARTLEEPPASPVKVQVVELNTMLKDNVFKNREDFIQKLENNPEILELSSKEYKIHLMPKEEYSKEVLERILDLLRNNIDLKRKLEQYKVALKDPETLEFPSDRSRSAGEFPRIVLYVEGKKNAQELLDAINNLFTPAEAEIFGCNKTPRLNEKVNSLLYYAQGSGDVKERAMKLSVADHFLEPDGIHYQGDTHLKIPKSNLESILELVDLQFKNGTLVLNNENFSEVIRLLKGYHSDELLNLCCNYANENLIYLMKNQKTEELKFLIERNPIFAKKFAMKMNDLFENSISNVLSNNKLGVDIFELINVTNACVNISKIGNLGLENEKLSALCNALTLKFNYLFQEQSDLKFENILTFGRL